MDQIKEFDTDVNCKRVAENVKTVARYLEKLQKSGVIVETTRIKSNVPNTKYAIIYKVENNPKHKLIAKRIIKHR